MSTRCILEVPVYAKEGDPSLRSGWQTGKRFQIIM